MQIVAGRLVQMGEVRVDALPVVEDASATTRHISRWWPQDDLYALDVRVSIADPDDRPGIDSVWFNVPDAGVLIPLRRTDDPGVFARLLPADSLSGGSVHDLLGHRAFVKITDRNQHSVLRPVASPVRIIEYTPAALSPQGLESVEARPLLEWAPARLPFAFVYRVEVVRDEANTDVVIQEHIQIAADATRLKLPAALPAGTYYWTVYVADAFGNMSRSKEAGFRVTG